MYLFLLSIQEIFFVFELFLNFILSGFEDYRIIVLFYQISLMLNPDLHLINISILINLRVDLNPIHKFVVQVLMLEVFVFGVFIIDRYFYWFIFEH